MTLPTDPAGRHRAVAAGFTARVRGASDWDAPAPVAGWRARDVVAHLVGWFPDFLTSASGLVLDRGPSPEEDPVAAWQVHADAVQQLLDGPEAATPFRHPMGGGLPRSGPGWWGSCRSRTRSTGSTPPTCSCTPGTWPAPPVRTNGSTLRPAPTFPTRWRPSRRPPRPPGSTARR